MERPYDLKDLGKKIAARAKAAGAEMAEEVAEKVAEAAYFAMKDWAKESAALSKTPFDDLAVRFIDQLDGVVLPQIQKIDLDGDGD
jgi:hypothetical protein